MMQRTQRWQRRANQDFCRSQSRMEPSDRERAHTERNPPSHFKIRMAEFGLFRGNHNPRRSRRLRQAYPPNFQLSFEPPSVAYWAEKNLVGGNRAVAAALPRGYCYSTLETPTAQPAKWFHVLRLPVTSGSLGPLCGDFRDFETSSTRVHALDQPRAPTPPSAPLQTFLWGQTECVMTTCGNVGVAGNGRVVCNLWLIQQKGAA
jgi:hypothetical protein